MTAKQQAEIIRLAIVATFAQAFPDAPAELIQQAARAAANNAAQALSVED